MQENETHALQEEEPAPEEENGTLAHVEGMIRVGFVGSLMKIEPFEELGWLLRIFYFVIAYFIVYYFQQFLLYMVAGVYRNCYHSWFWRWLTALVAGLTVVLGIALVDESMDNQKAAERSAGEILRVCRGG